MRDGCVGWPLVRFGFDENFAFLACSWYGEFDTSSKMVLLQRLGGSLVFSLSNGFVGTLAVLETAVTDHKSLCQEYLILYGLEGRLLDRFIARDIGDFL